MAIKDRIKEARLKKGYTQEQLAKIIGIAKSTLAGYELGSREPSLVMIIKIMKATGVDANYLWQDEGDFPMQVSYDEMKHIEKYRDLDSHGKEMVDIVLKKESERCENAVNSKTTAAKIAAHESRNYLNAAHKDNPTPEQTAHADQIMEDDSEWE